MQMTPLLLNLEV